MLPNMGNTGRITNSIGGLVGGGNTSRGASSTGVGNIPGLASRLNLAGNYLSVLCILVQFSGSYRVDHNLNLKGKEHIL